MAYLKQNSNSRGFFSWSVIVNLSVGKHRITLKGITDKRLATRFKNKAIEIETKSKLFPDNKDWLKETYIALGRADLIPNVNHLIPRIK